MAHSFAASGPLQAAFRAAALRCFTGAPPAAGAAVRRVRLAPASLLEPHLSAATAARPPTLSPQGSAGPPPLDQCCARLPQSVAVTLTTYDSAAAAAPTLPGQPPQLTASAPSVPAQQHGAIANEAAGVPRGTAAAVPCTAAPAASLFCAPAHSPGTHVVLFLNGLGGSTHDTRLLRSYLKVHQPQCAVYAIESHQHKATEGCLIAAAAKVAEEARGLLTHRLAEDGLSPLAWLSFVTFSLGGLVARLALRHPALAPFKPLLHAFVSVASPHLGLLYSPNQLVSAGVFLYTRLRGSAALTQLAFGDEPSPSSSPRGVRDCLLYLLACGWAPGELEEPEGAEEAALQQGAAAAAAAAAVVATRRFSDDDGGSSVDSAASGSPPVSVRASFVAGAAVGAAGGPQPLTPTLRALRAGRFSCESNGQLLRRFRHVVLLASPQDAYAPAASCAVTWCDAARGDARHGAAYGEMLRGFFDGVAARCVTRAEVRFHALPSATATATAAAASAVFTSAASAASGPAAADAEEEEAAAAAAAVAGPDAGVPPATRLGGLARALDSLVGREAHVAFLETPAIAALVALGLEPGVWEVHTSDVPADR